MKRIILFSILSLFLVSCGKDNPVTNNTIIPNPVAIPLDILYPGIDSIIHSSEFTHTINFSWSGPKEPYNAVLCIASDTSFNDPFVIYKDTITCTTQISGATAAVGLEIDKRYLWRVTFIYNSHNANSSYHFIKRVNP